MIFKNWAPFRDFISEINNTQIDQAKDLYVVVSMYNLIECSNNYSKTLGILCQCYRDESFAAIATSDIFKSKIIITGKTSYVGNTKILK